MSKQIRPRTAIMSLAVAVIATLLLLAASHQATAQQPQPGGSGTAIAASSAARNAAVVAATADVLQETSKLRELSIVRPVKSGAQSRAEIERMIVKNLNEDTTPEELRTSGLALKKLGLAPLDFELRPFIIKLLTEQVAGYYDPKTQQFYLADWIDVDGQLTVMSHELTHALQDQHFNLRRFEKWPKGDSDAELAAHALIEGDATFTMIAYARRDQARLRALMKSTQADAGAMEQIEKAPRALRESLLFPYQNGALWVAALFNRGGWARISQAFTELPQSTEQILHTEKYFTREAPVKVALPDIAGKLGADWKRIDYDVNGEWSLYLILDEYLKSEKDSKQAAAGWGGDRYAVYEKGKTGEVMIAQSTVWDTETDAREFFDAYAKRTGLRYTNAKAIETLPVAANLRGDALRGWQTNEGTVIMQRDGARVLILEGVPEKADVSELMKLLVAPSQKF
ncbi:MAG: DUF6782 family putative metallopeptidase [Pyrinomonadaceae bacterium]